ncbi:MAG: hypothetical protein OEW57_11150, partial [Gammaproteobacteria bacterium]|nr:hypothetical protein [Gammaproteobacteria bacterium]
MIRPVVEAFLGRRFLRRHAALPGRSGAQVVLEFRLAEPDDGDVARLADAVEVVHVQASRHLRDRDRRMRGE